eukprot:3547652-Rhodomonas_salina.1
MPFQCQQPHVTPVVTAPVLASASFHVSPSCQLSISPVDTLKYIPSFPSPKASRASPVHRPSPNTVGSPCSAQTPPRAVPARTLPGSLCGGACHSAGLQLVQRCGPALQSTQSGA